MDQQLLKVRNAAKAKKPSFTRQDSHKIKSLSSQWRLPRGIHSKMRKKLRGYMRHPGVGWSSPRVVRGLTPEGHVPLLIYTLAELEKQQGPVFIAGTVGIRKRLQLLQKAKEKNISVLNVKDIDAYILSVHDARMKQKELRRSKLSKQQKAQEEVKKIAEAKKQAQATESPEEKEKREKEEQRRILEQK